MHCVAVHHNLWCSSAYYQLKYPVARAILVSKLSEVDKAAKRRRALKRVDRELSKENFKIALSLVKQLQGQPGGLRGYGTAKQVPKKLSLLDESEINGIDLSSLHPLVDSILDSIKGCIEFSLLDETARLPYASQVPVKNLETPNNDGSNKSNCEEDRYLFVQHEAGHFLVAYLLGVLPKEYKIPSIQALRRNESAVGRIEFVGFDFLGEVGSAKIPEKSGNLRELRDRAKNRKISSKTLNRFLCVILGGLVAEYLTFGYIEGLHADVNMLDGVLKWSGFTKSEADLQVRWAALNTVFVLRRHLEARLRLAEAMAMGRSVGYCIDVIEHALLGKEI